MRRLAIAAIWLASIPILAGPNQAPVATMTAPPDGMKYMAPATIDLAATGSDPDGSVAKVEFYQNLNLIPGSAVTASPYTFHWANAPAGTYSIKARAYDNLGKTGDSATIQIQVVQPTTIITSPPNGALISGRSVDVTGTFAPSTVPPTTIIVTAGGGHSVVATAFGNNTFTAYGVELRPGENTIEVSVARADGTSEWVQESVSAVDAPMAVMIGPASCSAYFVPASITLSADAANGQGTISQVEFFEGSTSLGVAANSPYSINHTFTTIGTHSVFARATDSFGFTGDSAPTIITTSSPPPVVSITSPASGSSYRSPASIPLTASASDPDGTVDHVEYYHDGVLIGSAPSAPYSLAWSNVGPGNYVLAATAVDNAGMRGTSAPVSVTVATNLSPTVSITSPSNGASFDAPATVTLSALASDPDGTVAKVELLDGVTLLATVQTAPYSFAWNAPLGSHTISARATDNEGATATSIAVAITVDGVTASITSPVDGATFDAPASVTVVAHATTSSGTIANVELYDGAALQTSVQPATQDVTANFNLVNVVGGSHAYTVKAYDSSSRTFVSPVVTVNVTAPPTVTLTEPTSSEVYVAPAIVKLTADAVAVAGTVSQVQFFQNGAVIGTATVSPYTLTWPNVAAGSYTLTAVATDSGGRVATSAPVNLTVLSGPTISLDAGIDGSTVDDDTVPVSGTITSNGNSSVTVNGVVATITNTGKFFVNNSRLSPGLNSIEIIASTQDHDTATQTISVSSSGQRPFAVSLDKSDGVAPLDVEFTVQNRGAVPFGSIEFDLDSDGTPEMVAASIEAAQPKATFTVPGLRRATITVKDFQGSVIYATSKWINVLSPIEQAATLAKVHTDLMDRLAGGQVDRAMNLFSATAGDEYRAMFTALGPNLAAAVAQFGDIRHVMFSTEVGQLVIVRDSQSGPAAFMVNLIRGEDGIWRIEGM